MSRSPVHYEVLPNGLQVLLREAHLAPVVNLQLWAKVGSADERPGEEGLAHFHEHMLFKGTERRGVGEVAGDIEAAGGRINAYTSFDTTVYYATLPSEALDIGLDVLVDALRYSIFDPDEVKRETEVVLEEIRRSDDSPGHVLSDAVFKECYHAHPYGLPILGPEENVASFDRERVRAFFERWYTPDNLVVVAAGDFDPRALAAKAAEAFADAEPGTAQRERPAEPPQRGLRTRIVERDFEGVRVDLSWHAAPFASPDATHLELLSFILGESESSRLVRNVRERDGLANRIDSSSYAPLDPGLFTVDMEVEGAKAHDAIAATLAEIERMRREPVRPDELERAKVNFLASQQFERESVSGLASKLGSFHVLGGDWHGEEHYFDVIRAASADDLLRVAERYLGSEQLTVGALWPTGLAKDTAVAKLDHDAIAEAVAAGVKRVGGSDAPSGGEAQAARSAQSGATLTAASAAATGYEALRSYTFDNGATLHVLPRPEIPVVAARAAFGGGLLIEDESRAGLGSFLTGMWLRGTRKRSAADYARSVEDIAAEIDGFSGRNSVGLTLEVTREELSPSLDLFAELLLEPAFEPEELEREQRETLAAIDRREDRLGQQAFQLFGETLFPHHPYRMPLIGYRESVAAFDAAAVRAHHEQLVRADNLIVGVAGDVDPDAIADALALRLEGLAHGGQQSAPPPPDEAPSEVRLAERSKDRAQTHLVMGFRGVTVDDPDRYALEVITQILAGQGGRLFLDLRDQRSLAYTVSAANVEGVAPGLFALYIATAPEKLDQARDGMLEHLDRIVSEKPSDAELERATRCLTGNHVIDQQRDAAHAAHIALDSLYGLGPDAHQHYTPHVNALTADDILRVAQRIIRPDAYTLAVIR